MSKAAVRSMTAADSLLVEMPPDFDVNGDAGSIGRFNATSDGTNASVEMDIKGDKNPAALLKAAHGSSVLHNILCSGVPEIKSSLEDLQICAVMSNMISCVHIHC